MRGNVLVVGIDPAFLEALARRLPGVRLRSVASANDTEGLGTDVVVLADNHTLDELTQIRVHPVLFARPVVIVSPGLALSAEDPRAIEVSVVAEQFSVIDQVIGLVSRYLSQVNHPSRRGVARGVAAAS